MAMDKKQQQNIITIAVVAVAVIFAILALLVKFKIIGPDANRNTTTSPSDTELGSTVVEKSSVNEEGEVVYYTAIETYTLGDASALHWYPNTTKETKPQTELVTEHRAVTDVEGNPIYDENGEPATEVVSHTVAKTSAPDSTQGNSASQEDTTAPDENGEPVTNPAPEDTTAPSTEQVSQQEEQAD